MRKRFEWAAIAGVGDQPAEPGQVRRFDVHPMRRGFLYFVAVTGSATRKALSWLVSNTRDLEFGLKALEEDLARHGRPEIFDTDQGSARL